MTTPDDRIVQLIEEVDSGLYVLARAGERDEDPVLTKATMAAGTFIPLHRHVDVECLHVASGSLDVWLGDRRQWYTIDAGRSILVASDVPHAIRNVGDEPAETLGVLTVRLAAFLRELGTIAAAAGGSRTLGERRQSLRMLADRYGYWLAPSEESDAIRDLPAFAR